MKKILSILTAAALSLAIVKLPTVNVSADGSSGNYNYAEALQKSLMFYELQMSGKMPDYLRCNWKGDSCVNDGSDVGLDLSGGWYDAGDHVKFNLPMSYSATMLAWSYLEDSKVYQATNQDKYMLQQLKFVNDYFMRCHASDNVYYYQVGDGQSDHAFWAAAELAEANTKRPSWKVDDTSSNGGSAVCGETTAALAAASMVFKDIDPEFSDNCIAHAKGLYQMAESAMSDSGYKKGAATFYNSWNGFYDELCWGSIWLYKATGDTTYLDKAIKYSGNWEWDRNRGCTSYTWAHCWDDVHYGSALLLADITKDSKFVDFTTKFLDYWSTGTDGNKVAYSPKGEAWCSEWGSLRYATTMAYLAAVYADTDICPKDRVDVYNDFAKSQADYALGSSGHSFVVGFGKDAPKSPHHRTAHGGWQNDCGGDPEISRHTLYGALVGGPRSANDSYADDRTDYYCNEVACDYNAGYTGLVAKMTEDYGGDILENFSAVEPVGDEMLIQAGVNGIASGEYSSYLNMKTVLINHTAWPARVTKDATIRFFVNIGDALKNGYTPEDFICELGYSKLDVTMTDLQPYDTTRGIYYTDINVKNANIYPGGEDKCKADLQFCIKLMGKWDPSSSYSYEKMIGAGSSTSVVNDQIVVIEDGKVTFGKYPSAPPKTPVVSLTNNFDTVYENVTEEKPVVLSAKASVEEAAIKEVQFYSNGKIIGTDSTAPYNVNFVPAGYSSSGDGIAEFAITAKAISDKGATQTSEEKTLSVVLPQAPKTTVKITSPTEDITTPADKVTITADAANEKGSITKVEFFANNEKIGEDTTYPYNAEFPLEYQSETQTTKDYIIVAKATSSYNTIVSSAPVTINVALPEKPPINADISLEVAKNDNKTTNAISNTYKITNNGGDNIDLSKLEIRYYFTHEGNSDLVYYCDNAGLQLKQAPYYVSCNSTFKGQFTALDDKTDSADTCFIMKFTNKDAFITDGGVLTIVTRIANQNWSPLTQTNDYSYANNANICIYYDNKLIMGNEL